MFQNLFGAKRKKEPNEGFVTSKDFYDENRIILDECKHVLTPPQLLEKMYQFSQSSSHYDFYYYGQSPHQFVTQSLQYANKTFPKCSMRPFNHYYPNFDRMSLEL
ncbi:hypothetical protein [Halalkalibacter lacteus]|uniref:hypothetical protein n=1 Tax=Halalkalibacter lacteus TaxID=3090663 RepID=UPI002FCB8B31